MCLHCKSLLTEHACARARTGRPAVHEARGHAGGSSSGLAVMGGHRPNAHGGALNARGAAGAAAGKLLPTANNMGKLDSRFNAGAVRVRDDLMDTLGRYAGSAGSAVVNQVKAAHNSKAALAANSRSKDRADRATGERGLVGCLGWSGCVTAPDVS